MAASVPLEELLTVFLLGLIYQVRAELICKPVAFLQMPDFVGS